MPDLPELDLIIKNVRVVRPNLPAVDLLDLGISNGKFVRLAPEIPAANAKEVFDGERLRTIWRLNTGQITP